MLFGFFGLPPIWMFLMAGVMFAIFLRQRDLQRRGLLPRARRDHGARSHRARRAAGSHRAAAVKPAESVVPLLSYDPMELEIGFGLIPLVDVAKAATCSNGSR